MAVLRNHSEVSAEQRTDPIQSAEDSRQDPDDDQERFRLAEFFAAPITPQHFCSDQDDDDTEQDFDAVCIGIF